MIGGCAMAIPQHCRDNATNECRWQCHGTALETTNNMRHCRWQSQAVSGIHSYTRRNSWKKTTQVPVIRSSQDRALTRLLQAAPHRIGVR